MPQIFRARNGGRQPTRQRGAPRTPYRERGYDARWDRRSKAFRREQPFCQRCEEVGRTVLGTVVDHKMPVADGGAVHCPDAGLWTLCQACHGWKGELEAVARRTDQMHLIVLWCDDPSARPVIRGEVRYGGGSED